MQLTSRLLGIERFGDGLFISCGEIHLYHVDNTAFGANHSNATIGGSHLIHLPLVLPKASEVHVRLVSKISKLKVPKIIFNMIREAILDQ